MNSKSFNLPVIPLRDIVLFPGSTLPLLVGREHSVAALEACMARPGEIHRVFLVTQKNGKADTPTPEDMYEVGVIADVLQMLQLESDGRVFKIIVEAGTRAKIKKINKVDNYWVADLTPIHSVLGNLRKDTELIKQLTDYLNTYAEYDDEIKADIKDGIIGLKDDPSAFVDSVVYHIIEEVEHKQKILELSSVTERLEQAIKYFSKQMAIIKMERNLRSHVKQQMEKSQREYFLNEHMKAIQKELGNIDGGESNELSRLEKKITEAKLPTEALEKAQLELKKLKMMPPMSSEASVLRGYLEWIVSLPWSKRSVLSSNLKEARTILDQDHHGLEKIKERVMEYLAVHRRVQKVRGSILCFVGPPGVGKTSLGASIARATNRKFVRMSLGGVSDEAEIRGHRRTYIGSLPGKILQKMSKAATVNPLFLLDEVDKMGMDYRGDPAAALLEVLDPEQNNTFNDHYLEVNYDLSEVLFICTANSTNIPAALLDRMELIRIPGYTEQEKQTIAKDYLLPRQLEYAGMRKSELRLKLSTITDIIRYYTREAGVRQLEKVLAKICRKVLLQFSVEEEEKNTDNTKQTKKDVAQIENKSKSKSIAPAKRKSVMVSPINLEEYCGVHEYEFGATANYNQIGQAYGLAWTNAGGEVLTIEASVVPGKARHILTGSLGDVMKESIQAAMTVIRARADTFNIDKGYFETMDVHVHFPEGATPKDGPSAGTCICLALLSAFTEIPVKSTVAMTGELTLHGDILPIGGLKEKLLAAKRSGMKLVLIPEKNIKDLKDISPNTIKGMVIKPVSKIDEVFAYALERMPSIKTFKTKAFKTKIKDSTTQRPNPLIDNTIPTTGH